MAAAMALAWRRMRGFGFGFDHDAGEGFGAGVADDDAAGVGEREFGGGDGGGDGGDRFQRPLFADVDVDDDLGEDLEVGGELRRGSCRCDARCRAAASAVSRPSPVVERPEKRMWPDCSPPRAAPVASICSRTYLSPTGARSILMPRALERGFQAHVGHGGGDDGGVGEQAAGIQVAGGEQQDGVAIDDFAVFVGEEGAVGVAVEGDAHGRLAADDFGGDDVGMERAAVLVDVAAVGRGVGEDDCAAAVGVESAKSSGAMALAAPLAQSMTMRRPSRERSGTAARRKRMYSARIGSSMRGWRGSSRSRVCASGTFGEMAEDFGFDGQFGRRRGACSRPGRRA